MSTIFGEESFIDKAMVSIIEERGKAIDNLIYDEIAGVAKYELPMPNIIIDRERVKKWLILCSKLENIEHTNLVNMATAKKFEEKNKEIKLLKKALELASEVRDDWGGREYDGTEFDNYFDYFIAKAKEQLK